MSRSQPSTAMLCLTSHDTVYWLLLTRLHDNQISTAVATWRYIYYSKFASDHYLGQYYHFRHGYHKKLKMACIRGHVYFLNFIAVCQV